MYVKIMEYGTSDHAIYGGVSKVWFGRDGSPTVYLTIGDDEVVRCFDSHVYIMNDAGKTISSCHAQEWISGER